MNRTGEAELRVDAGLSDTPWPVAARDLLTERERSLYERLLALYPEHKIFVQVALSQLIDVPQAHPQRLWIRRRFSQLVADFVLCRPNLSIVAVIELDDRSHERADRKGADARKNKALADAGLRLVRIPAGPIPSEDELRELIDPDPALNGREDERCQAPAMPAEPDLQLGDDWESVGTERTGVPPNYQDKESRALQRGALKMALVGAVLIGGWFLYSKLLPLLLERAFANLVVSHVVPPSSATRSNTLTPPRSLITSEPNTASPEESAERTRAELRAVVGARKQKELEWAAFYSTPASCEHPIDWAAQVECGNQYMRAKREFEKHWAAAHSTAQEPAETLSLDNASITPARR